jgi:hypothetical protein
MRTSSKTPGLRIVGGTAYGQAAVGIPTTTSEPVRRADPPRNPPLTETARNTRLREQRKEAWRCAEAATQYWRARLRFDDAIAIAQLKEIPEGNYHPARDCQGRLAMIESWRDALARQLLTPAPDLGAVKWKEATLAGRQVQHSGVKPERIERAIVDDLAFLAAHPVGQSKRRAAKSTQGGRCELMDILDGDGA